MPWSSVTLLIWNLGLLLPVVKAPGLTGDISASVPLNMPGVSGVATKSSVTAALVSPSEWLVMLAPPCKVTLSASAS